jgi:hypothetical protein
MRRRLAALRGCPGTPLTRIGVFTEDRTVVLRRPEGDVALPAGFAHFK